MNINKVPQRKRKTIFGKDSKTNVKGTLYKGELKPMHEIIIDVINKELVPQNKEINIKNIFDFISENIKDDFKEKTLHFNLGKLVKKGELSRRFPGVYEIRTKDSYALLLKGNGRDLSFINDSEVDGVYYDHAWDDGANKDPGKRKSDGYTQFKLMADFPTFQMEQKDMDEIHRVIKSGRFCVLNLPKEGADNQEYLEKMLKISKNAGKKEFLDLIINLFNKEEQEIISNYGITDLNDLKGITNKMSVFKKFIGIEKFEKFEKEFVKKIKGKHFKELEKKYNESGFDIYAKIDWNKETMINQGRVVKDREQIWFLSKGRARDDMRVNNKTRMKALDMVVNVDHDIHNFVNKDNSEGWNDLLNEIKSTPKTNRSKKRDLLNQLIKNPVVNEYFDFYQKKSLSHGNEVNDIYGSNFTSFDKLYKTLNSTMMGAKGILPSEIKIKKPKKGDKDYFGYSTEKPLKLQETIIQFILMKGETILEPATGGGSMMEAAINEGVNYIGVDISEKSIQTCVDRLKLKYKSTEDLLNENGLNDENQLKELIKEEIINYKENLKNNELNNLNYQERVYFPEEKLEKFKSLLIKRGFEDKNINEDVFKNIIKGENDDKIVFGGNIYPHKDEILRKYKNAKYHIEWECIVINK